MINFQTTIGKFDSPLWGYHFLVPEEIAREFISGNDRRVICKINTDEAIQCALMPSQEGWFILVNKEIRDKLGLQLGDLVSISMEKDESEFGMPMPETFKILLDQDEEANTYFESLTPGKQRNLIYIVGKVKNIDSQLNKGLAIVQHLKEMHGNLNFRILNRTIKEFNSRNKLN